MRVFAFVLEYAEGVDRFADAFREYAGRLYARSLAVAAASDHLWRVDRLVGERDAVAAAEAALAAEDGAVDCLSPGECDGDHRSEVLHRDPTGSVVYSRWGLSDECRSVPHLALEHLGPGVLFHTDRRGDRYEWRILLPDDAEPSLLYDAMQAERREGVDIDVRQVTDESTWVAAYSGRPALSHDQYEAIRVAVERGYYETPREATVEELAAELDVPSSTLSYRLRRAEAEMATSFVGAGE